MAAKSVIAKYSLKSLTKIDRLISLGQLGHTHGLAGFIKVHKVGAHLADFVGKSVQVASQRHKIAQYKRHTTDRGVIQFENIETIDQARQLTGSEILVPLPVMKQTIAAERQTHLIPVSDCYYFELIDLTVQDHESKKTFGVVEDVIEYDHNTVLVVRVYPPEIPDSVEIPFESDCLIEVDLEKNLLLTKHFSEYVAGYNDAD